MDDDSTESNRLLTALLRSMSETDELLDTLENVLSQACLTDDDEGNHIFDSMALSAYADGLRVLAEHGRVDIVNEYGRRVIAIPVVTESLAVPKSE